MNPSNAGWDASGQQTSWRLRTRCTPKASRSPRGPVSAKSHVLHTPVRFFLRLPGPGLSFAWLSAAPLAVCHAPPRPGAFILSYALRPRAEQPRRGRGRALPPPPCPCPCPSLSFSRFCLRNPGTAGPTRTVPRALRGEQVSEASPHFLRLGGEADSVPRIPAASPCPGDGSRRAPPGRAHAATSLTSQSPAAGHGRPPGATPPGSLRGPRGGG